MAHPLPRQMSQPMRWGGSPLALTLLLLTLGFVAAPWSMEHKAHMALHGLCAQRPSHSFWVGAHRLPFDARMMGIYVGFLAGAAVLLATSGHRRSGGVSWRWAAGLAMLVGVMGVDGLNSTLLDMRLWHPYAPSNWLRVATGAGAGLALAIVLAHLVAITVWRTTDRTRFVVDGAGGLLAMAGVATVVLACIVLSPGWVYGAISLVLIGAALGVLSTLALVGLVLARRLDYSFTGARQLQPLMVQAIGIGVVAMTLLSIARSVAERFLGTTMLT